MMSFDQLKARIGEVLSGSLSIDNFEDWFRNESRGSYASSDRRLSEAAGSVEAAFSKHYFEGVDEAALKSELEKAIGPQVWQVEQTVVHQIVLMYGDMAQRAPTDFCVVRIGSNHSEGRYIPSQIAESGCRPSFILSAAE